MKKEGNKKMPTPRQKLVHSPIPTSLFIHVARILFNKVSIAQFMHSPHSQATKVVYIQKQKCRDGVINKFQLWFRYLLVSLLFMR